MKDNSVWPLWWAIGREETEGSKENKRLRNLQGVEMYNQVWAGVEKMTYPLPGKRNVVLWALNPQEYLPAQIYPFCLQNLWPPPSLRQAKEGNKYSNKNNSISNNSQHTLSTNVLDCFKFVTYISSLISHNDPVNWVPQLSWCRTGWKTCPGSSEWVGLFKEWKH